MALPQVLALYRHCSVILTSAPALPAGPARGCHCLPAPGPIPFAQLRASCPWPVSMGTFPPTCPLHLAPMAVGAGWMGSGMDRIN